MLFQRLQEIPSAMADFIRMVGQMADEKELPVYLVGGFVRDLLLKVENFDVDFLVAGDAVSFAQKMAHKLGLEVIVHHRFGTATLLGFQGFKADFATARKENYELPGALPSVQKGSVKDDLLRRDFTINAMAISLNKRSFGKIIDYCHGQKDLKKGLIRAMHDLSFMDDPTRILRAVRFEQRFNFRIESATLRWVKEAVRHKMLERVQKHRLRDELLLIFKESRPLKSLKRLRSLAGFSYVAPKLKFQKQWERLFPEIGRKVLWYRDQFAYRRHLESYQLYLALFLASLPLSVLKRVIYNYAFHKDESKVILSYREHSDKVCRTLIKENVRPSVIYRSLEPLCCEAIVLITAVNRHPRVIKRLMDFLHGYYNHRLHIQGGDLKAMGLTPGPRYKYVLDQLLDARIDGKIKTKEQEWALARKLCSKK